MSPVTDRPPLTCVSIYPPPIISNWIGSCIPISSNSLPTNVRYRSISLAFTATSPTRITQNTLALSGLSYYTARVTGEKADPTRQGLRRTVCPTVWADFHPKEAGETRQGLRCGLPPKNTHFPTRASARSHPPHATAPCP